MNNQDLVRRINAALAERNISKAQFYRDCEITSGAYSQWNQNRTSPSRKTLKRIADYFGWSEEYLLLGQQKKPSEEIGGLTTDEQALIDRYRKLSPQSKAVLRRLAAIELVSADLQEDAI